MSEEYGQKKKSTYASLSKTIVKFVAFFLIGFLLALLLGEGFRTFNYTYITIIIGIIFVFLAALLIRLLSKGKTSILDKPRESKWIWLGKRIIIVMILQFPIYIFGFIFTWLIPTWDYVLFLYFITLIVYLGIELALKYLIKRNKNI